MALTPKQQRFVEEYLIDLNATQAALRAGYSEKTAHTIGWENLQKQEVGLAIQEAQAERSKRTEITQDRVLQELARVGFSDLRNVLSDKGAIIDVHDWDDDTARAISSVEVVRRQSGEYDENDNPIPEYVHKFRAWDKVSALEKMGRHLGMFPTKVDHTSSDGTMTPKPTVIELVGKTPDDDQSAD